MTLGACKGLHGITDPLPGAGSVGLESWAKAGTSPLADGRAPGCRR